MALGLISCHVHGLRACGISQSPRAPYLQLRLPLLALIINIGSWH